MRLTDDEKRDRKRQADRRYYEKNREAILTRLREQYPSQRESKIRSTRKWQKANPERVRTHRRTLKARVSNNLRSRLIHALKGIYKTETTMKLIGCSLPTLKEHIEKRFSKGMSWDNYGRWHLDHIRPLASFDLQDPIQQRAATHYTNLQPLWARDNMSKGAKF